MIKNWCSLVMEAGDMTSGSLEDVLLSHQSDYKKGARYPEHTESPDGAQSSLGSLISCLQVLLGLLMGLVSLAPGSIHWGCPQ